MKTDDISSALNSDMQANYQVEIYFSDKVEYYGSAAQTIAFLKREDYSVLDLKAEIDLDKMLDLSANTEGQRAAVDFNEVRTDLCVQL